MSADLFEESRRLTGANVFIDDTGAALETARGLSVDDDAIARWRDNIAAARVALGWAAGDVVARRHRSGVSLAFAAPPDQLYAAAAVNEWAWVEAMRDETSPPHLAVADGDGPAPAGADAGTLGAVVGMPRDAALAALGADARAEARPALLALAQAAAARGLPFLADDDMVSIGAGGGAACWSIDALPAIGDVHWSRLHDIPTALVTGSNGKTTTVRLVAAMTRAHGWSTAHSCTDGVYMDDDALEAGDFSGPTGARTALRHPRARAAVLETARGGMLRRGLAVSHANVAVVTNVAVDHFGEYGVHDLEDLARVKLTVARAIDARGLLVLNADDALLRRQGAELTCRVGWFWIRADGEPPPGTDPAGPACWVDSGRMRLRHGGGVHDLGAIADMPLGLAGSAGYNIANIAAAALVAAELGVPPAVIAATAGRFGSAHGDNPGRLQSWRFGATRVVVDYAHNTDGLDGLLRAVGADQRETRLGILLGHAGNREDDDLRAVAAVAAAFSPELVVLKDIGGYERGRGVGEVPEIMGEALLAAGLPAAAIRIELDEVRAARMALEWAHEGDLLVLPMHELDARLAVVALLDTLRGLDWRPGMALPAIAEGNA